VQLQQSGSLQQDDQLPTARCCCLIPCYNEASRISNVLHALQKVEGIDKIVCVDDGSSDGTARIIVEKFPEVQVICLPVNQGKAVAVRQGAARLDCEYIFLLDADLTNIEPVEFSQAVHLVKNHPQIDLLILRRINKDPFTRLARGDVLISGERILRRVDLLTLLTQQPVTGFQLEVAINQFALDHQMSVYWHSVSSVGLISFRKMGFWKGLFKEIRMFYSIYAYLGFLRAFKQILTFGKYSFQDMSQQAGYLSRDIV
jgi:glycosyltransferase involved in cell wall biosynthesis